MRRDSANSGRSQRGQMARVILYDPYWRSKFLYRVTTGLRRKLRSPIFAAIEAGDDDHVLRLATQRTLLKAKCEFGQSPLAAAIGSGRSELAVALIAQGGSYAGDGSLALAAMSGDLKVVEALLAAGKGPDEPQKKSDIDQGFTPLMWAANRRHIQVAQRLLAAGANVDAVAQDGSTAAMLTAKGSPEDLKMLEVLCAFQPDIHKKDWRGRSVIREARDREKNSGRPEMRQILERHFPNVDFNAS